MEWTQVIMNVLGAAIGSGASIWGAIKVSRIQEKSRHKQDHFNTIKREVLKPWLNYLKIHRNPVPSVLASEKLWNSEEAFTDINKHLFDDTLQHFPLLRQQQKAVVDSKKELDTLIENAKNMIVSSTKSPILIQYNEGLATYILDPRPHWTFSLGNNVLMYGSFLIASGEKDHLHKIKEEIETFNASTKADEIRKSCAKLKNAHQILEHEIEAVLARQTLQTACSFLE